MKYLLILIMMVGMLSLNAQNRTTQTRQRTTTQATTAKTFTLTNGKLGPIQVGKKFVNIPATYSGLYDKYTYKKIYHENEMDGDWTEEYYQFTKGGKNVFRAEVYDDKTIHAITLQEGSSGIVKTSEGFYVGYPARTLYTKKKMEWTTYFEGTVFAFDKHYVYHVNYDELVGNVDSPTAASHFKSNAKVCMIVYSIDDHSQSEYY